MIVTIKVLANTNENKLIGWFGNDLLKLRLIVPENTNENDLFIFLKSFLNKEYGIRESNIRLIETTTNFFKIELPDQAWEIFLGGIK